MQEHSKKIFKAAPGSALRCVFCSQLIDGNGPEPHYWRFSPAGKLYRAAHVDCAAPGKMPDGFPKPEAGGTGSGERLPAPAPKPEPEPKPKPEAKPEAGGTGTGTGGLADKIAQLQGADGGGGEGGEDSQPVLWTEFLPAVKEIENAFSDVHEKTGCVKQAAEEAGKKTEALAERVSAIELSAKATRIEITNLDTGTTKEIGLAHFKFAEALEYLRCGTHLYLYGPKGGGKSTLAKQLADALGLPYGYISLNPLSSASRLEGFMSAGGEYVGTEFQRIYEHGGVFCVDELDNAAANVLTTLNGALANDFAAFAHRNVPMHPNFRFVGTGNTVLRGATLEYPERRRGDESVMDRLMFIEIPYDRSLEAAIAQSINPWSHPWILWVHAVRDFCEKADSGARGVFATPRAVISGARLLLNPAIPVESIIQATVFKGIPETMAASITKHASVALLKRGLEKAKEKWERENRKPGTAAAKGASA